MARRTGRSAGYGGDAVAASETFAQLAGLDAPSLPELPSLPSLPSLPGGGRRRGRSPYGPEPGSDEDLAARAATAYANKQGTAEALGLGDRAGRQAIGLLEGAAKVLDAPKSAVVGALFGGGMEEAEGQNAAERFWRGITGQQSYGYGDIDAMRLNEGDAGWERVLKRGGAFLGDVAFDPLTYASFGGSVIGKQAASGVLKQSAKGLAKDAVGSGALKSRWADEALRLGSAKKGFEDVAGEGLESYQRKLAERLARDPNHVEDATLRAARETAEKATTKPPTFAGSQDEWLEDVGSEFFGSAAAEAYTEGGSVGLRQFLKRELGDEAGERAFDALPRDVRGGVRITAPLTRDRETGASKALAFTGGGGRGLEKLGLSTDQAAKLTHWRHRLGNRIRGEGIGRHVGDAIGGYDGKAWGAYVKDTMVRGRNALDGNDLAGVDYHAFDALRSGRRAAEFKGRQMDDATRGVVGRISRNMVGVPEGEQEAAEGYLRKWFFDTETLATVRRAQLDPNAPDPFETMSAAERAGFTSAVMAHDYLGQMVNDLRSAGVTISELNDYIPRIITREERDRLARLKPARTTQGSGASGYDQRKMRKQWQDVARVEDEAGELRLKFRHLTAPEINELAERNVFEANPVQILAQYGDAARRLASRTRFANFLHERGVLAVAGQTGRKINAQRYLREIGEDFEADVPGILRQAETQLGEATETLPPARVRQQGARQGATAVAEELTQAERVARETDTLRRQLGLEPIGEDVTAGVRGRAEQAGREAGEATEVADAAEARLLQLEEDIALLASDREGLRSAMTSIFETPDVERQFKLMDDMMDSLVAHYEKAGDVIGRRAATEAPGETRDALMAAKQAMRQRISRAEANLRHARSGKQELDPIGQFYRGVGGGDELRAITDPNLKGATVDALIPPELDMSFAPDVVRQAVRKFYEVSGGQSGTVSDFLDSFYKPYFQLFKLYATVGRGPGYHARNTIGGVWNNFLYGVKKADHTASWRIQSARQDSWKEALNEKAEELARTSGMDITEARKNVSAEEALELAERKIEQRLSKYKWGDSNLYAAHRLSRQQGVGQDSRVFEGVHDMLARQDPGAAKHWQARRQRFGEAQQPDLQMFRNRTGVDEAGEALDPGKETLKRRHKAANWAGDNWWVNKSRDWAGINEDFLRDAAFLRGLRDYGFGDEGVSAKMIADALHFDYQDLSDFERKWMRGTIMPFYVWTRHNVPLQFRALMKEPGKMHRLMMANDAARDIWGDEEEDVIPEWMREKMGWATKYSFGGNPIMAGIESPATDLNKFVKAGPGAGRSVGRELLSSVSPAIKLPLEAAFDVDAFTGAQLSGRGVEAPIWYRALANIPGVPSYTDEQGRERMPAILNKVLSDAIPPLGQVERLAPTTDRMQERWLTSVLSQAAAMPVSTLTESQRAGELNQRVKEMDQAMRWGDVSPELEEAAAELIRKGLPPDMVRQILQAQGFSL